MIDDLFVINLSIRADRLTNFMHSLPDCFAGKVTRWEAVHGDSCRNPSWWNAGAGAWGCYRSHISLLEYCMSKKISSYMVFEDDSVFVDEFDAKYSAFMDQLPWNWDMFYLGGQLIHADSNPPEILSDLILRPYNVNRTHCFAVHHTGYKYLYEFLTRRFEDPRWHIDHHLGRLHEQRMLNVYCPNEWLVGQGASSSNISGNVNDLTFYPNPEEYLRKSLLAKFPYCVYLNAPRNVVEELITNHRWHCGYTRTNDGFDVAFSDVQNELKYKIRQWFNYIYRECLQHQLIPFLWHPGINAELFQKNFRHKIFEIKADTVEDALNQAKGIN
jgi:GR25 family glycosyltransferase involved in LPS biosynthesis